MSSTESIAKPSQSMVTFFIIWTGQAFSLMGSSLVQFALIWWLTKTAGSAVVLALAAIITIVPNVFLSPLTGTLVDRWSRRLVILVADSVIALATIVLAVLFARDIKEIGAVFLIMFIRALGTAFHRPAMVASTTLMVPKQHYSRIAGLNNALRGTIAIVSPPLGALLLELLPMQGILAIDVGTALLAIGPLFFIPIPQPKRRPGAQEVEGEPSVLEDMVNGLRFIWNWPGLMMLIGVYAMVHLLLAPSMALMPLLVTEHFKGEALQLAWLESAMGIGLVTGGLTLGIWGGFRRRMVTAMLALALMGVGMTAVGLAPATAFPQAVGGLFMTGFAVSFVTSLRLAVLQASVPPELQGRVITVALNSTAATDPVGLAIAGPLANSLGVGIWYVLGGIITMIMGVGSFFVPAIMRIEDRTQHNET
jgi:DHA3 family macrolide efflux protein-like MFS transporter